MRIVTYPVNFRCCNRSAKTSGGVQERPLCKSEKSQPGSENPLVAVIRFRTGPVTEGRRRVPSCVYGYLYGPISAQKSASGWGLEKAKRMRGLGFSELCRQGATAADQAHLQARRRAIGGIMRLPMCSRSGDGSCGTWRSRGSLCWRPRRQIGIHALMGRGGELCGPGLSCGGAIEHRAFAWVWGIAGRAGRACGRAPPLARVHLCLV